MAIIYPSDASYELKRYHVHVRQPRVGRAFEQLGPRGSAAAGGLRVYLILNAFWQPLDFELPPTSDGAPWRRWIDTALESPEDIVPWPTAPVGPGDTYGAAAHSVIMLFGDIGRGETS
jgi:glycogen operon protein